MYQMAIKTTFGRKIDKLIIKNTKIFLCKTFLNLSKFGFFVWKYNIWLHCSRPFPDNRILDEVRDSGLNAADSKQQSPFGFVFLHMCDKMSRHDKIDKIRFGISTYVRQNVTTWQTWQNSVLYFYILYVRQNVTTWQTWQNSVLYFYICMCDKMPRHGKIDKLRFCISTYAQQNVTTWQNCQNSVLYFYICMRDKMSRHDKIDKLRFGISTYVWQNLDVKYLDAANIVFYVIKSYRPTYSQAGFDLTNT
jgi:hypothetical protein